MVNFSADLWQPYRSASPSTFRNAPLTLDGYHLIQLLNRALEMSAAEQRSQPGLKKTRYVWLKRPSK